MFRAAWFVLLAACACAAHVPPSYAQHAVALVRVTDEAGSPLPGTHVFVDGTTIGDAADADGRAELWIPAPRAAPIRVSAIGFASARVLRAVAPGDTLRFGFALQAEPVVAGEVEVAAERGAAWQRRLDRFAFTLLGYSENARHARLLDPNVLRFEVHDGTLHARTVRPLEVRNLALAYDVTLFDLRATVSPESWEWSAGVRFDDLCAPACSEHVLRSRAKAYVGSAHHFARAAVSGRLRAEGFQAEHVEAVGDRVYPGERLLRLVGAREARRVAFAPDSAGWRADVPGALWIRYSDRRRSFDSWLTVEAGVLRVGPERTLFTHQGATYYGAWNHRRLADMLPADYEPPNSDL